MKEIERKEEWEVKGSEMNTASLDKKQRKGREREIGGRRRKDDEEKKTKAKLKDRQIA